MGQITTTQNLGQSIWALSFTELALFLPSGGGGGGGGGVAIE